MTTEEHMAEAIPQRILDQAEDLVWHHLYDLDSWIEREPLIAAALAAAEKRGREAEREECAKVAETMGVYPELNVFAGGPEWYRHGKDIAAAIRSRSNP